MSQIAQVKDSSILDLNGVKTTSATVVMDVSTAGSPGNLDPEGFTPNGIAKWVDRSSGFQIAYPSLTLSSRPPTKVSRLTRVQVKYVVPTLEITSAATSTGISPAPTKAYEITANLEFLIPERATLAERTLFYSKFVSLLFKGALNSANAGLVATGSPIPDAVLILDKPF